MKLRQLAQVLEMWTCCARDEDTGLWPSEPKRMMTQSCGGTSTRGVEDDCYGYGCMDKQDAVKRNVDELGCLSSQVSVP